MTSSNNKLKRNDNFTYYEPITPIERPNQEISVFCPTTSNIITDAATTQGTEEASPTQDQAGTPSSSVSSTQAATTAASGKWFNLLGCNETWYLWYPNEFRLSTSIRPLVFARLTLFLRYQVSLTFTSVTASVRGSPSKSRTSPDLTILLLYRCRKSFHIVRLVDRQALHRIMFICFFFLFVTLSMIIWAQWNISLADATCHRNAICKAEVALWN